MAINYGQGVQPVEDEKYGVESPTTPVVYDEKKAGSEKDETANVRVFDAGTLGEDVLEHQAGKLGIEATAEDLADAEDQVANMSLERCKAIMKQVRLMHQYDQNFPAHTLESINELLDNPDVEANPQDHSALIYAMKLEAVLVTSNSPYAEVRAVVDPTDDPSLPSSTFRMWFIGILFSAIGAFINELFAQRNPPISITSDVAQVLAYPLGKFMAKVLPTKQFKLFGKTCSLNPGPFNKKEHMLITVMVTIAFSLPYTGNIIFVQALPMYFNQPYARNFGYQITNTLGSQFIGYGLAGLCRRFLVYPSFCIWPTSLSTLALNKAFHADDHSPIPGPFKRMYSWSRLRFFFVTFIAMGVWFFIPGYLFEALMVPNWMTWIAPTNQPLAAITGHRTGLGIDPISTFEWSWGTANCLPLVTPLFSIVNQFIGFCIAGIMILGVYYTNTWNTGYLPINTNKTYDNKGKLFNVSRVVDQDGKMDNERFQQYSEPWMSAGNITCYFWFFAIYTAMISYTILYHRHEIAVSFRSSWRHMKKDWKRGAQQDEVEDDLAEDIHWHLMKKYKEVPEWWYFVTLLIALGIGMAGVAAYPTHVTPAVVPYGVLLALIFMIPIGLIYAVTGQQVTLNVIAEFIGASMVEGDALSMNMFKMYGYITAAHALSFSKDLKLAHYTKIPPRTTFWAQMVATLVSAFVATALFNFLLDFKGICTADATFNMSCPGVNTFFTASVFWGTYGPIKLFGPDGHYKKLLIGFPVGFVMPFLTFYGAKAFKKQHWIRSLHPVAMAYGGLCWAPYNMSHQLPGLIMTTISWAYIKPRFLAFWARYNYILYSAFTTGVAVSAIIIFFALQIPEVSLDWWGNTVPYAGCDQKGCVRMPIPEIGYFGPAPGTFK